MRCLPCLRRRRRIAGKVSPVPTDGDAQRSTPGHASGAGGQDEPHRATQDASRPPASRPPLSVTLQSSFGKSEAALSTAGGWQRRRARPVPVGLSRASSVQLMEAMASPRSDGRPTHLYGSLQLRPAGPGSVPNPEEGASGSVAPDAAAADAGAAMSVSAASSDLGSDSDDDSQVDDWLESEKAEEGHDAAPGSGAAADAAVVGAEGGGGGAKPPRTPPRVAPVGMGTGSSSQSSQAGVANHPSARPAKLASTPIHRVHSSQGGHSLVGFTASPWLRHAHNHASTRMTSSMVRAWRTVSRDLFQQVGHVLSESALGRLHQGFSKRLYEVCTSGRGVLQTAVPSDMFCVVAGTGQELLTVRRRDKEGPVVSCTVEVGHSVLFGIYDLRKILASLLERRLEPLARLSDGEGQPDAADLELSVDFEATSTRADVSAELRVPPLGSGREDKPAVLCATLSKQDVFAAAGDPEVLATLLEAMQGKKVASFAEGLEAGAELLIPHCRGPLVRTESGDTQTDSERSGQEVTRHSSFRTSGSGPNTALEEAEAEERRRVFVERGLGPLWHSLRDALAQARLTASQTDRFVSALQRREFAAGELIVWQGEMADGMYIVFSGTVWVTEQKRSAKGSDDNDDDDDDDEEEEVEELKEVAGESESEDEGAELDTAASAGQTTGAAASSNGLGQTPAAISTPESGLAQSNAPPTLSLKVLHAGASLESAASDTANETPEASSSATGAKGTGDAGQGGSGSGAAASQQGEAVKLVQLFPGSIFGERALVKRTRRVANVQATTASVCLYLSGADFAALVGEEPSLKRLFDAIVAEREILRRKRSQVTKAMTHKESVRALHSQLSAAMRRPGVKHTSQASFKRATTGDMLINQYRLLHSLGAGSYGKVKLAEDMETGTLYAIKMIKRVAQEQARKKLRGPQPQGRAGSGEEPSEGGDDAHGTNSLDDVAREVAIMKKLRHSNIVALHEVIDDPMRRTLYLVTEFVEAGAVLSGEEKRALPLPLARKYVRDVLRGLHFLHFHHIYHRDIKPENILVSREDVAKLADFGVSAVGRSGGERIARPVGGQGTPAYMAPEVLRGETVYDGAAADMWSLGATVFHFLVGRPPFPASSELELERLILSDFDPLTSGDVSLEPSARDMLWRLLHRSPGARMGLEEFMAHPWVTLEGSDPLPIVSYPPIEVSAWDRGSAIKPGSSATPPRGESAEKAEPSTDTSPLTPQTGSFSTWTEGNRSSPLAHGALSSVQSPASHAIATTGTEVGADATRPGRWRQAGGSLVEPAHGADHARGHRHGHRGGRSRMGRGRGHGERAGQVRGGVASSSLDLQSPPETATSASQHLGSDSLQTDTTEDGENPDGLAELGIVSPTRRRGKTGTGPGRSPPGALQLRVRALGAGPSSGTPRMASVDNGSVEVDEDDANSASDTPQAPSGASALLRTGGAGTSFLTSKLAVGASTTLAGGGDEASMDSTSEFSSAGEEEDDDSDYDAEELDLGDEAAAEEAFGGHEVQGPPPVLPGEGAEWEAYCRGLAARGEKVVRLGGDIAAVYASCACQGTRPTMEDVVFAPSGGDKQDGTRDVATWGVCDGHSGSKVAEAVAAVLPERMSAALATAPSGEAEVHRRLSAVFRDVDGEIGAKADEEGWLDGSTAVTVSAWGEAGRAQLVCANVGDAEAKVVGGGEEATCDTLTVKHVAGESVERARVEASGAFVANRRVMGIITVSRAFGDIEFKSRKEATWPDTAFRADPVIADPAVVTRTVDPGRYNALVVASDGLWDKTPERALQHALADAVKAVAQGSEGQERGLGALATTITQRAIDALCDDNVSVHVIHFVPEAWVA